MKLAQKLKCQRACSTRELEINKKMFVNRSEHLELVCKKCKTWHRYISPDDLSFYQTLDSQSKDLFLNYFRLTSDQQQEYFPHLPDEIKEHFYKRNQKKLEKQRKAIDAYYASLPKSDSISANYRSRRIARI